MTWLTLSPAHLLPPPLPLQVVPSQYQGSGQQERLRCHCVAAGFDRYALQDALLRREGSLQALAEVLVSEYHRGAAGGDRCRWASCLDGQEVCGSAWKA